MRSHAGTFTFLLITTRLEISVFLENLNALLYVLMIASLNAFNEEFTLRAAPWVSSLMLYVKKTLLITTVFFALGHYFGVPNGIIGVVLSGFLGWFIGKSIFETHESSWPGWLILYRI